MQDVLECIFDIGAVQRRSLDETERLLFSVVTRLVCLNPAG
eukprot:SAG31_NODE_5457_length_2526_cov_1.346930_3_plen_41_part_00